MSGAEIHDRHVAEVGRAVTLAIPVLVPSTMAAVFAILRRGLAARTAYKVGFAVYPGCSDSVHTDQMRLSDDLRLYCGMEY